MTRYLNTERIMCSICRKDFLWDGKEAKDWTCGPCAQLDQIRDILSSIESLLRLICYDKGLIQ